MRKAIFAMIISSLLVGAVHGASENPFFTEWKTAFGAPPFDQIKVEHYVPAINEGMSRQIAEIDNIVNNPAKPTFENTVAAMDGAGRFLGNVRNVFFALNGSITNPEMQAVARDIVPRLSEHRDKILLNNKLFKRVKDVYQQQDNLNLNQEQKMLLLETYKQFVRGGANLNAEKKLKLTELNGQMSLLTLGFGENILKEVNKFSLILDKKSDLVGLPQGVIDAAVETASNRDLSGKWVFTLDKPSLIPFLQYSERRDLREIMYKGYINQGDNNNELDNKNSLIQIANLRLEKANLLGYKTHAHFVLEENMAKEPENVYELLDQVWKPALIKANEEVAEFQKMIDAAEGGFKLAAWDWWYYAEKVKLAKYNLDEEMLRPYFEITKVRDGMFAVANKLWGLTFTERPDIQVYHKDVTAFEVTDADGSHLALLMLDYFPRPSKRGGAWMDAFRKQHRKDGQDVRPIIFNVCNFTKPTADVPSLLSVDEVTTMYHEFGHALHGMMSDCTYMRLSGTSVTRDFVELPSQIMENWALEPEVLELYARHYKTGELIPADLVEKIHKTSHFNQGFATSEYVAASYLDMDWHTITKPVGTNANEFEAGSLNRIGLIKEIASRYRSSYFRHIFAGGYSSGYYSYMWAEVLDADAFNAFKETGNIFDKKTAMSFRENVLERGGSVESMEMYNNFRGKKPGIEPLLKRRGLN